MISKIPRNSKAMMREKTHINSTTALFFLPDNTKKKDLEIWMRSIVDNFAELIIPVDAEIAGGNLQHLQDNPGKHELESFYSHRY